MAWLCLMAAVLCTMRLVSMVLDYSTIKTDDDMRLWQALNHHAGLPSDFPFLQYLAMAAFFWLAAVLLFVM